jgi:hypothetical protein
LFRFKEEREDFAQFRFGCSSRQRQRHRFGSDLLIFDVPDAAQVLQQIIEVFFSGECGRRIGKPDLVRMLRGSRQ